MSSYDQWMAPFHPMSVHFPIVLLIIGLVCDIVSLVAKEYRVGLRLIGHWMIIVGALLTIPAVLTGWSSGKFFGWEDPDLIIHRYFGIATLIVALANGLLRLFLLLQNVQKMIIFPLVLSILCVALVSWSGETGGMLTHGVTPFQTKKIGKTEKLPIEKVAIFSKPLFPKFEKEDL